MSLGLEAAYGNEGLYGRLRQQVMDQIAEQQRKTHNDLQLRSADRADRALNQQDELTRLRITENKTEQANKEADRQFTLAEKANEAVPAGTVFPSIDNRPSTAPIVGRLSMVGALAPTAGSLGSTTDTPADPKTGTPPSGRLIAIPSGQVKLPSANQANVLADNARADAASTRADQARKDAEAVATETARHNKAMEGRPVNSPTVVVQGPNGAEIVDKNKGTSRPVVTTAGAQLGPAPTAAERTKEADTARAHDGLDQVDAAIAAAQDLLGPGEGRLSSAEQFIGNPDPRISTLGTKLLMAKMRADASLGGVRAAASPQLLARWDNLLTQKLTPENLHATVQAMREMLGPRKAAGAAAKLSADELIKKYGGGQ